MGHFGLFEFEGSGENRSIRLTPDALAILLDQQSVSPERDALIKKAALKPPIHKELWNKWQADLPSDPTLMTYLVRDRGFSEGGARDLITEYRETIKFAKLSQSDNIPPQEEGEDEVTDLPEVGDLVQVEVGGALQLEKPALIRAIQERDGQKWVFVEGSTTGIEMENVQVIKKGDSRPPGGPPPILALEPGWREERLLDDNGEEILIRYKGDASPERYTFIRDYLDFKLARLKPKG
jgi:hypothetical protein